MTPIALARRLARRDATAFGHRIGRMRQSAGHLAWIGVCLDCGCALFVRPIPYGEWVFTGPAIRLDCVPAPGSAP